MKKQQERAQRQCFFYRQSFLSLLSSLMMLQQSVGNVQILHQTFFIVIENRESIKIEKFLLFLDSSDEIVFIFSRM